MSIYMRYTRADGASSEAIELIDFSFGAENTRTVNASSSGSGAGRTYFNPFSVTKSTDSSSVDLFQSCAEGEKLRQVLVSLQSGDGNQPFLTFKFTNVLVSSVHWGGSNGDNAPTETIDFSYGELIISYQDLGSSATAGFETADLMYYIPFPPGS